MNAAISRDDERGRYVTEVDGHTGRIDFRMLGTDLLALIHTEVPPEIAQERIDAAVAAGGTVVSTDRAPRFTVLADPQGNKVCICTHVGRTS